MAQKIRGWHPEKIKAELRIKFGSLRAFAVSIDVAPSNVSEAIKSPRASTPIEVKIAEALGVQPYEIWPTRWTRDGQKIDRSHPRQAVAA
jgi:Ner family transcriptional regulator